MIEFYTDQKRHLVCVPYSIENLHWMAKVLGIAACWYHGGKLAHYDCPIKQEQRIYTMCNVVSSRDIIKIIKGQFQDQDRCK